MANAIFYSNLTHLAGDEGTFSQVFNLSAGFRSAVAGSIAVARGTDEGTLIEILFGKEGVVAHAVVVRNATSGDLGGRRNETSSDLYRLGPGGVFFHWSPTEPGLNALQRISPRVGHTACEGGSIDYVVLSA
jgi:hypothetical protein